jgi:peroxiredoxin
MKVALAAVVLALLAPAADLEVGKPVPDVKIGDKSLAELTKAGKVVAVYFWSQDCPYGPPQFARLKEVAAKYAGNEKVAFLSVASFGEKEEKVAAWAKDNELKAPLVFDAGKAVAKHFGARKVNYTFVIDAKGNLVYRGGFEPVGEAIEAALKGTPAPKSDAAFQGCGIKI